MSAEKLCIFCKHFSWTAEEMWGMGSTMTGPMMEGGWAECSKDHYISRDDVAFNPTSEAEYRRIILLGENCEDYERAIDEEQR